MRHKVQMFGTIDRVIATQAVFTKRLALFLLLGLLLLPSAHAQQAQQQQQQQGTPQQPFTIKIDTQLVVETVIVKDKDGKNIEGLTEKDFNITEDNIPQTISVFQFQKLDETPVPEIPQSKVV